MMQVRTSARLLGWIHVEGSTIRCCTPSPQTTTRNDLRSVQNEMLRIRAPVIRRGGRRRVEKWVETAGEE
jgi:hypothetical protein